MTFSLIRWRDGQRKHAYRAIAYSYFWGIPPRVGGHFKCMFTDSIIRACRVTGMWESGLTLRKGVGFSNYPSQTDRPFLNTIVSTSFHPPHSTTLLPFLCQPLESIPSKPPHHRIHFTSSLTHLPQTPSPALLRQITLFIGI